MIRLSTILLAVTISGCVSVGGSSALQINVHAGDQLTPWGVQAGLVTTGITLTGQVNRTALPRGPLREHVHVEILDASGQRVSVHDAHIYPVTALRAPGTARLSLDLPANAVSKDGSLNVIVVDGVPHG
jgi:hypothetical protein